MLVKYFDNVGVLTSQNVWVYNEVKSNVRSIFGKNVDLFNMITLVVRCKLTIAHTKPTLTYRILTLRVLKSIRYITNN